MATVSPRAVNFLICIKETFHQLLVSFLVLFAVEIAGQESARDELGDFVLATIRKFSR